MSTQSSSHSDTQSQIISSLFSRRDPLTSSLEETYIAHLKIWEDIPLGSGLPDEGSKKARYLMLAVTRGGKVLVHKAKRNNNGSFSKGKTWGLEDLRGIEVISPQTHALTMTSRTYSWQTERPRDQSNFLITLIKVYRKYTQGRLPNLVNLNFSIDDAPAGGNGSAVSPPVQHAQPQAYGQGQGLPPPSMPQATDLRARQGSYSSVASSQFSTTTGPSIGGPRPSQDGGRYGSFSSNNGGGNGEGDRFGRSPSYSNGQGGGIPVPVPMPSRDYAQGQGQDPYQQGSYPGNNNNNSNSPYGSYPTQSQPQPQLQPHSRNPSNPSLEGYSMPKSTSQRSLNNPNPNPSPANSAGNGMAAGIPRSQSNSDNVSLATGGGGGGGGSRPSTSGSGSGSGSGVRRPSDVREGGMRGLGVGIPSLSQTGSNTSLPSQNRDKGREPASIPPPAEMGLNLNLQVQGATPTQELTEGELMTTPVPGRGDGSFGKFEQAQMGQGGEGRSGRGKPILKAINTGNVQDGSGSGGGKDSLGLPKAQQVHLPPDDGTHHAQSGGQFQGHNRGRRASFVPPPLSQSSLPYSRDLLLRTGSFSQAEAFLNPEPEYEGTGEGGETGERERELEDATMANVEEILEGFDWSAGPGSGGGTGGAEAIESRLLDELNALEAANIHAFLESDDRISNVLKGIDDAIGELDDMDNRIAGYKMQLGGVTEDIAFIESQNRGLQVQTANQQALLKELEQLLENVSVDPHALRALTQESLETERGIQNLEGALSTLYKALLAIRDRDTTDMAAAGGRKDEYETHNRQFCLRVVEYLAIMVKFQADTAADKTLKSVSTAEIPPHEAMESKLGMYCGLILYMLEMDEERYQKLCTNYFNIAGDLHHREMKALFMALIGKLRRPSDDDKDDGSFAAAAALGTRGGAMQRSRAVMGNLRGGDKKEKRAEGEMRASEALDKALQTLAIQVGREEGFIADFLHITDSTLSYADYMDMESYFLRQALRYTSKGLQPSTVKLRRSALDFMFGFVSNELKDWVDGALQREQHQVFGMMAVCERSIRDAEDRNAIFFLNILQRQMQRLQSLAERYLADQVKTIENAQMGSKKRRGVAFFIKHFPIFVQRIETQLVDYDDYAARNIANAGYEQIVNAMFDTLQHMAKLDKSDIAGEDKGQLNQFIIMIENMHFYVQDAAKNDMPALRGFLDRAQALYEENMTGYIRAVLRRSFGRIWDFFDAVQRQIQTTSAQEVSSNSAYNKSALKRAIKDTSSGKEMRKAIDALVKRIEKHFSLDEMDLAGTEDGAAMNAEAAALVASVTASCERQLVEQVGRWSGIMGQCYAAEAASGVGLEYGPGDVEAAFKKARA